MQVLVAGRIRRGAIALAVVLIVAVATLVFVESNPRQASAAVAASTVLESKTGATNNTRLPLASTPSISGDGRFEVFTCATAQGGPACPGGPPFTPHFQVMIRDRATGTVAAVPRPSDLSSLFPVISRDGCHVAFMSPDGESPLYNVYRWTRPECGAQGLVLASRTLDGQFFPLADADIGQRPAISADGRIVAYSAKQFTQPNWFEIKVVDLGNPNGSAESIEAFKTAPPVGTFTINVVGSHEPALSDDGRFVFYTSDWNPNLNAGKGGFNGLPNPAIRSRAATQIWRYDRTKPVGVPTSYFEVSGAPGVTYTYANSPAVSANGDVVAFSGRRAGTPWFVDLKTISTGQTTTIFSNAALDGGSADPALFPLNVQGALPDFFGGGIAITPDGTTVVYETNPIGGRLSNLRASGNTQLTDRRTGAVQVVSVTPGGAPSNPAAPGPSPIPGFTRGNGYPAVTASGRVIAFYSGVGDQLLGDGQMANTFQVYARLRPPEVTVGSVDFGAVTVATPAAPKPVTITNTGLSNVVITGVVSSVPAEFPIGLGDCAGLRLLAPGQSCTVSVGLTPSAVGARSSTLTVTTLGPGFDFQPVTGAGSAVGTGVLAPGVVALVLEPGAVDLGQVPVGGTSNPTSLVLRNTGTADATIAGTLLDGTNAAEFKIVTSDCPLAPAKLLIAGFCTVTVAASPVDDGLRTARLSASTVEGPVAAAALSVTGVRTPVLQVAPAVVAAGGLVTVSGQSFPRNVSVRVSLGSGEEIQAVTDANGAFSIVVLVMGGQPTGPQTVSVRDDAGRLPAPVTAPLLVVASTFRPQGSLSKPGGIGIISRG